MKKLIATGLAVAFIAGMTTITMAKPVSEMDLDISGLAQFNYNWSEIDTADDELDTARLRLKFAAQPAENVSIYAELEGTNNISGGAWGSNVPTDPNAVVGDGAADSRIVEMYTDLTYIEWMTARIGQFALPNSYELNVDEYDLETIRYSQGVGIFGTRDRGIMLFGQPIPEFGWAITVMNGGGAITGANNDVDDLSAYGLQLDWNPLTNLNFKLWGQFQDDDAQNVSPDADAFGLGFNYTYQGFHLMGEYNDADVEATAGAVTTERDITQWFLHASYIIPETTLQIVLRYDKHDMDRTVGAAAAVNDIDKHITTAGFNWDFEKNARLQLMHQFVGGTGMGSQDSTDLMLAVRF